MQNILLWNYTKNMEKIHIAEKRTKLCFLFIYYFVLLLSAYAQKKIKLDVFLLFSPKNIWS